MTRIRESARREAGSRACSGYTSCLALCSLHVPTAQSPDVSLRLRTEQRLRTRGGLAMGPANGPVSRRDGADPGQQSPGDRGGAGRHAQGAAIADIRLSRPERVFPGPQTALQGDPVVLFAMAKVGPAGGPTVA